jgi:hypothetical protein
MLLPLTFPALPGPGPPTHNIQQAYHVISESFNNSLELLRQDHHDPLRIQFHINRFQHQIFPLYIALSMEQITLNWLQHGAHLLGQLHADLEAAVKIAEDK